MDRSWRPRPPPTPGNVCPICSIHHFPFCHPHPPSFNQNPRFQSYNSYAFERPLFDPFFEHLGPPENPHRPFIGYPSDRFGDPPPWHGKSGLEHGQFPGLSPVGDSAMVDGVYGNGFAPSRYDHGSVGFKRIRVDEMGTGSYNDGTLRSSAEDERRLKLIRDHGIVSGVSQQGGANSMSALDREFNREAKGYVSEYSVFGRNFANTDGMEHRRLDESTRGKNDTSKPSINFEMNDFQNPSSYDRKGTSFNPELGFNSNSYRSEQGLSFGQQDVPNYRTAELGKSQHGQDKDSGRQSLHLNRLGGHASGQPTNNEQGGQGQHMPTSYHEGKLQQESRVGRGYLSVSQDGDLNKRLCSDNYSISEVPSEDYYGRSQGILPGDSLSAKEPQFSHPTGWQGCSATSAPHNEQRGSFAMENGHHSHHMPQPYAMQNPVRPNSDFYSHSQVKDGKLSNEVNMPSRDGSQGRVGHENMPAVLHYGPQKSNKQVGYVPISAESSIISENIAPLQPSRAFNVQPPLPASPPPQLVNPPLPTAHILSPPRRSSLLFPIPVSSAATVPSYDPIIEARPLSQAYLHQSCLHASTGFANEEFPNTNQTSSKKYTVEGKSFSLMTSPEPKVVDASHIFKQPHRATRPDHMVIILRGLPGSGKSYVAKMLRDLEIENGGDAPRIHSMDDYFMTEVEKVDESDASKSSGFARGKRPVVKTVMEYCYEPEMEEAYRSSMLKAFKKTLDDGTFSFVIVDDRNLRVADFAQFWATAKRSGYEVYLLEATYKDPAGCAARNVHGFTLEDIQKMAELWEEAPSLYMKMDIKSLFHGDDLKETGIQEVDMDTEDGEDTMGPLSGPEEKDSKKNIMPSLLDYSSAGASKKEKKWDAEGDHLIGEVKELGRSKWSDDLDDDNAESTEATKGNFSALSGLIKAYAKERKSVHWGDQAGNIGFSIGAARKLNGSLVIGPGAGYNLKSNPLPEDQGSARNPSESKRPSIFQERLRAERESFRAVFDKRRQRIGRLELDEE